MAILWLKIRIGKIDTTDQHQLQNVSNHNHAAEASRVNIVKVVNVLKEQAQQTNDQPIQIIQTIVANISHEIYLYLLFRDALRQSVKRM
ncbi:6180_t:CDS:2 [Funneliformis geosporum]|uniref:6180_t:CDS:1 n=1 Tax=Funneliformis geosporum TaxID=1117311 RepID=A0A9W4SZN4_9GLOM|nr:6180_t:CDS:2 [Funneliformis geosporum]